MLVSSEEVRAALEEGRPVVALESTIIAHGLPHPANLDLAGEMEAVIREAGAVPATVAVIDGVPRVGLEPRELTRLAEGAHQFTKAGTADLAPIIAAKGCAATTVSATSFLAHRAGVRVFATGGIGGAHRDDPNDVSADLLSLSRVPMAVVSAGPKAILDLPRTAEVLESLQVLVLGFQTQQLPAFYCRSSDITVEHSVESATDAASILRARWDLGQGGVLVANPVPVGDALPREEVEQWIVAGLLEAKRSGATGKALTPFLLQFIAKESGGRAVRCNCALAKNNAQVAANIAVELCK